MYERELSDMDHERAIRKVERLTKLVRNAYNEGFNEGMRENDTIKGGKTWMDSNSRTALADITGEQT